MNRAVGALLCVSGRIPPQRRPKAVSADRERPVCREPSRRPVPVRDLDAQLRRAERLGHRPRQGWFVRRDAVQRDVAESVSSFDSMAPGDEGLVSTLRALAEKAAARRIQEGAARDVVVAALRPLLSTIRARAGSLSAAARRDFAFLCAVAWSRQGPFWARAVLGAADYAAAHNLQYTLQRFDNLRRAVALSKDPAGEIERFRALESNQIPYLPSPYRALLQGWKPGQARDPAAQGVAGSSGVDPREAKERARVDRLLQQLTAVVEARGISSDAGRAVAAAVSEPQIFHAASRQQLACFLASALAAGDEPTASLILELAPEARRGSLRVLAQHARSMHWDVTHWLLANVQGKDLVGAYADLRLLTSKPYWQHGMPRYAAMDDRRKLIYAIQARLQSTSQSARAVAATQSAYDGLRAVREAIIRGSTERDAAVLRATSKQAIIETDLPQTTLEQAFMGELFGSVGLDPDQGRKVAPSELLIKGLRALAERAGIDVDGLIESFGKGKKALLALAKDPSKVLSFAIGALSGAFRRFASGFPKIIQKSLIRVILGPSAGATIQQPAQWNLKSTAGFMMQLAGLTADRVWALVRKLAGKRGTAFIERVAGPVMTLFSGKPARLLDQVEGQLEEAKTTAFDTAKSWLLTNVVTRAIVKLATLFSPVGAAIGAIQMIGNLLSVLGTWGSQIAAVVTSFTDSLTMIAEGKVKPAADRIFDAIVGVLPAVMSFLVGFVFGGSKLFTSLREGIRAIGDRIWKIVVRIVSVVVQRVQKMFPGRASDGRSSDAEVADGAEGTRPKTDHERDAWWRFRKPIALDGERHHFGFGGQGAQARLAVFSTETPLDSVVASLRKDHGDDARVKPMFARLDLQRATFGKAKNQWVEQERSFWQLTRAKKDLDAKAVADEHRKTASTIVQLAEDIHRHLVLIARETEGAGDRRLPKSRVTLKPLEELEAGRGFQGAARVEACPLSFRPGNTVGSAVLRSTTSGAGDFWKAVRRDLGYLERAPLLSPQLHGPGNDWRNLAILPTSVAREMATAVRRGVLPEIEDAGRVFAYRAYVKRGGIPKVEGSFEHLLPSFVRVEAKELVHDGHRDREDPKAWKPGGEKHFRWDRRIQPVQKAAAIEALHVFTEVLKGFEVDYRIGGGIAAAVHGLRAEIGDADVVVEVIGDIPAKLLSRTLGKESFLVNDLEKVLSRGGSTQVLHRDSHFKIDVMSEKRDGMSADDTAANREEKQKAAEENLSFKPPQKARVTSAEDILIQKLAWFEAAKRISGKQWEDCLGIVARQGPRLDRAYVRRVAVLRGIPATVTEQALAQSSKPD